VLLGGSRRGLLVAEVDARDLTTCRLLAVFERPRRAGGGAGDDGGGDLGVPVAFLAFEGAVDLVHTAPEHRRRGIASALLEVARTEVPGLGYSADHTADGAAWGRGRGLAVPEAEVLVPDQEVAWAAAGVYLHLTHVTPDELLWERPLRLPRRVRRPRWLGPARLRTPGPRADPPAR
jgi:GNAT superfamily N-acetyltransferase